MTTAALVAQNTLSLLSGADLSAKQFHFVKVNSSGQAISCDTAGEQAIGVNNGNVSAAGYATPVQIGGVAKVYLGGTVAAGDKVMTSSAGRAIARTGTNNALGVCLVGGASGEIGAILLSASDGTAGGGLETVSAPGAISPSTYETLLEVDGTDAFTMGDGQYLGQRKRITCITAANSPLGTVTLNGAQAAYGSEQVAWVFTTPQQWVEWEWTATGWKIVGLGQAGVEVVANAGTANPLCLLHTVVIADTVDFIQPAGVIAGQRSFWVATSASGTPVGTVSGLFYTLAGAATGVDVTMNAGSDAAFLEWIGARWYPLNLISTAIA